MNTRSGLPGGFAPFPDERAQRYRNAGYWTHRSVDSLLRAAASNWPDRVGVVDGADRLSFGELDQLADLAAAALRRRGVSPGDRVLLQLPNTSRFPVAFFGLLRAGALPVMCLPGHRFGELSHFLAVSDAVGLIIADRWAGFDYRVMAAELVAAHPGLQHVIVDGDPGDFTAWTDLVVPYAPDMPATPDAPDAPVEVGSPDVDTSMPALLLVSGGTTGYPKLIPRTHDDYVYNATASAALCGMGADDVYLAALPAAHNFPLACPGLLGAISVGATTVMLGDPSPESAFATIDAERVTVTALVPALAKLWAQACEWEPVLPTTLRLLQVGGAKLGAEDAGAVRAAIPGQLQQVFGMAEGLLNFTRLDDTDEVIDHTQGRPLSEADEVQVVDDAGDEVATGEEGELLVRGPYTINGYFNADAVNERAFTVDGFYRSGDKVRRGADGSLEVTGRIKDVIHRAGETVSALDLEEHLLTHPAVWSVAAVALPDQFLGEKICAAVVFRNQPVTLTELHRFLDQRGVAAYARPDVLAPVGTLPMTAVGKVDKKAIVEALSQR